MAVHVICCYFLPFIFFFFAQIAFPKSIAAFALGISALSVSCLILYFKILDLKKVYQEVKREVQQEVKHEVKQEPVSIIPPQATKTAVESSIKSYKTTYEVRAPILDFAKYALHASPRAHIPNTKAVIAEQQQALASQKSLFTEELEKRTYALAELQGTLDRLQQALQAKESEVRSQTKEIEDLKFELYTLLRIESYATPQKEQDISKLAAASF